ALAPGESRAVALVVEPRLLAVWDGTKHAFRIAAGDYRLTLASSARDNGQSVTIALPERWLPAGAGSHP
ncbi:MAG TPA: fibronectin type III-like domain-contianing protein, partial [Polyangiaceae bacterium]|nr:fibronectin type III-like domain-contianing protein [Polyangiaceae bacterium]